MTEQLHIDDFPEKSRERVMNSGRLRTFSEREALFLEGDISQQLYILQSGAVDIGVSGANGKRLSLNIVGPGCVLGEVGMLDGKGRTAEAISIGVSEIRILTREQVFASFDSEAEASRFFNLQLCKRIRWINRQSERSRLQPAPAVVASRLLMTHAIQDRDWLEINQETLAHQCGLTREYVSQILSRWSEQGVIKKKRGEICIVELAALQQILTEF